MAHTQWLQWLPGVGLGISVPPHFVSFLFTLVTSLSACGYYSHCHITFIVHSHKCMGVNGEALQLHTVTRESVSGII